MSATRYFPIPPELFVLAAETVSRRVSRLPFLRNGVMVNGEMLGVAMECLNAEFNKTLELRTPTGISGIGSAMFFPANNGAAMANAPQGSFGGISGVLRIVQNIGILGSFVIAITVASASISRSVASEVFIGTRI